MDVCASFIYILFVQLAPEQSRDYPKTPTVLYVWHVQMFEIRMGMVSEYEKHSFVKILLTRWW